MGMMTVDSPAPLEARRVLGVYLLGAYLRLLRERIPPESQTLGGYVRLPVRCGRRVTQEEIAEAVGVSRGWYRQLEGGVGARASIKLLDRLAAALLCSAEERFRLFTLAVPEIRAG